MYRKIVAILIVLCVAQLGNAALKRKYGGNLRVADELLADARTPEFSFAVQQNSSALQADLRSLNPDQLVDIEKHLQSLQDPSNTCHWILDYPFLDHQHASSISLEDGLLTLRSSNPDSLRPLLASSCLLPPELFALQPFRKTQFGYEANWDCLSGRPFLDSITPVPVDPVNPYLSFKLRDVDIIPVPEDRFQQIAADPEIALMPGLKYFVFFKSAGLSAAEISQITAAMNMTELARTALNEHAEMLFQRSDAPPDGTRPAFRLEFPSENPYRLMGERLELQLKDAGFAINKNAQNRALILAVQPILQRNDDLFRYLLLKEQKPADSRAWVDQWEDLQRSGRLIPLMVHISRIAFRKNIQELSGRANGMPDLANCWLLQEP